ncbi:Ig-like domain repeat protein, partial [Paracidovorax oryzae]|uniref:Ig-like domain repeat protein n=1 Tax=Paracidovorax oryzae TaxID=862720 RepID=UPI00054F3515
MVANVSANGLGLGTGSLATLGQRGVFGNAAQGRGGEQAYVNLANGNLVLQRRDDFVASQGLGMDVLRTYNSQGLLDDDNADNWSIGIYNQPLRLSGTRNAAGSVLTRTAADGARSDYAFDAAQGLYVGTDGAGAYDSLRWDDAAGQYVWTDGDSGAQERYEGSGDHRLLSRSDAHGNTTRYQYSADGLLSHVVDASGETTWYDYAGRNLSQVRVVAKDGTTTSTRVHYAYDALNRLSSVTVDLTPGDNDITDGKVYQTTYTYDGDSRRVATVAQSDGTRLAIGYVLVDGDYRVASVQDALGLTTRYAYDTAARTTTVTDPLNVASRYAYDDKGQLLRLQAGITEAKPAGLSQLYYRYDDKGNVTAMTDALGRSIAMQYDAHGNQTLKVDPLGNTVVRTYDDRNQLLTETLRAGDGNNNAATTPVFGGSTSPSTPPDSTTRYIYSAQERGQLRFVVSAEGRVTEYRYNSLGQRETTLAYAAAAYDLASLGSTSVPTEAQMAAWAAGQDLRGGQRTDLRYDFRGQLAQSIAYGTLDASGAGSDPAVTQYVYSQAGELLKTVQPRTDSITQYVYDGLGRVIVASAPSSDGTSANTTITSYGDTTTTVTLANGLSTVSNYDAAGRLTSVLQSSAGTTLGITRYAYDTAGRLVMTQDATGVRQWVVYDAAGRKVADVDGTGAAREYRYNANDQLTQTIEYATRLAGLSEAPKLEAIRALASTGDRSSWRLYDSAQRLAWQVDAGGAVTQTEYDAASRVVAVTRLATPIDTAMLGDGSAFLVGGAGLVRMDSAGLAATAIAMRTSAASVPAGSALTLEAAVSGSQPAGTVTFYSGNTVLGTAQISNGVARLTLGTLAVGTYAFTARYEGDATHAAATSATASATVLQAARLTLDPLPATLAAGRASVLKATIAGTSPGGTVTFFDGATVIGSAVIQATGGGATATLAWSTQDLGNHAISAVYSGDAANAQAVTASTATVKVGRGSEIALDSSATPSTAGTSLAVRARVSVPGGQAQPTGSVAFYRGSELLGTATLDGQGLAVLNTSALPVGLHAITAVYQGDDSVAGSSSATFAQTVLPPAATTAVLATSHVQVATGGGLTLTARIAAVADPAAALGGTVTFFDGDTRLGSVALANGQASFGVTGVGAGSHGYRAVYSGDTADAGSTSATASVLALANGPDIATPSGGARTLALSASASNVARGGVVTLNATVAGDRPTGSVVFVSGGKILGSASVADGKATVSFIAQEAGSLDVQALYSGDANNAAIASPQPVRIMVAPAAPVMALSLSSSQAVRGAPVAVTATLSGSEAAMPPTGSVTFYANGVALGTAVLSQGRASLDIRTLDAGTNSITVQYAGDARNAAATSAAQELRILPAPASVALSASAAQGMAGAALTFTATIAPAAGGAAPAGRVDFFNGTVFLGSATIANGAAVLTTSALRNPGTANITAVYTGDAIGAVSPALAVSISSGVDVSVSSPKIASGNAVVLSANVGSGTGQVNFFDGSVFLGSASAVNGVASLTTRALVQSGAHAITAVYAGDANRAGATSAAASIQVAEAVEVKASSGTVVAGAPLVLTASVNSTATAIANGLAVTSDGTVTKTSAVADWESSIRSTVGLTGGASVSFKAGQTNKAIMVGLNTDPATNSHYLSMDWALYITYDGAMYAYQNGVNVGSLGTYTTGDVLSVDYANGMVSYRKNGAVLRQEAASITQPLYLDTSFHGTGGSINALKFRNAAGQEVPLNASAVPTGTVTFFNGREVLGTANVVNGAAQLMTSALATVGTAQITAVYSGDVNNVAANSAATAVAVTNPVGLSASSTSVAAGDAVTLTARMNERPSAVASGATLASGTAAKTGTASQWDASVRSTVGYAGGASVRFTVGAQTDQRYMVGLTTDPAADNTASSIDWAIHVTGGTGSAVELYHRGVLVANVGAVAAGDVLGLSYAGGVLSYSKNGVVLRQ